MIVVRLKGGLGNQMFQYAAGLRLARRHSTQLALDLIELSSVNEGQSITPRLYSLDCFGLSPKQVNRAGDGGPLRELRALLRHWRARATRFLGLRVDFHENGHDFDEAILDLPSNAYLNGYFQDARYFSDIESEIRSLFKLSMEESELPPETRKLAETIRSSEAICLHVRRGDYLLTANSLLLGTCPLSFFQRSLDFLAQKGRTGPVYIFSEDEEWCRESFPDTNRFHFVDLRYSGPKDSHHLWLMTLCSHFVISNSSFAWWAAWLAANPEKLVCRPKPWFRSYPSAQVCPFDWVGISSE